MSVLIRAAAQEHGPPVPLGSLDHIGMTGTAYLVRTILRKISLGQDRIVPGRNIRSCHTIGQECNLGMALVGAALGGEEAVTAVLLEQVRPLYPHWMRRPVHTAVHKEYLLPFYTACPVIEFVHPYRPVPFPLGFAGTLTVIHDICPAVLVEEERRVNALDLRQKHRVGPNSGKRVRGGYIEIADSVDYGVHHIEKAVGGIVAYGRGIYSPVHPDAVQIQLGRAVQHETVLGPVHHIPAVENRDSRIEGERGVHQIIVIPAAAYARVREEAGQYGVEVLSLRIDGPVEAGVVTAVAEACEQGVPACGAGDQPCKADCRKSEGGAHLSHSLPKLSHLEPPEVLTTFCSGLP